MFLPRHSFDATVMSDVSPRSMLLQPVILCGGSGTRLWPLSRQQHPKQLLALNGNNSMIQATALRLTRELQWVDCEILRPIIVGNEEYRFISAEQLRSAGVEPQAPHLERALKIIHEALELYRQLRRGELRH